MEFNSAYMTESERSELIRENETVYMKSSFGFMSDHNGPRPGCFHVLLSNAGTGKTTLTRAMISDFAKNHPIGVWCSEEDEKDFKLGISRFYQSERVLNNINIFSELDLEDLPKNPWQFLDDIENRIRCISPRVHALFIDNITTSYIYNDKFDDQPAIIKRLIKMAKTLEMPIFAVAHTGAHVGRFHKSLIQPEDVRGKKSIVMESHFFYVMQQFETETGKYNLVRVDKHRGQTIESKLYFLKFDKEKNTFTGDKEIKFSEFKDLFNGRNQL